MDTERLQNNLSEVRDRIAEAAARAGRTFSDIQLVAVTKSVSAEIAERLVQLGVTSLGESRPQMLWQKHEALSHLPVEWHLVGHLQRNKARRTAAIVQWIHSIDKIELLEVLSAEAALADRIIEVLIEVNVSGEPAKHGAPPEQVARLIEWFAREPACTEPAEPSEPSRTHVRLRGLMAMSGLHSSDDEKRREFQKLRELRDALAPDAPAIVTLDCLSMGMSDDFEIAIEQGATMIRLGSCLFK